MVEKVAETANALAKGKDGGKRIQKRQKGQTVGFGKKVNKQNSGNNAAVYAQTAGRGVNNLGGMLGVILPIVENVV